MINKLKNILGLPNKDIIKIVEHQSSASINTVYNILNNVFDFSPASLSKTYLINGNTLFELLIRDNLNFLLITHHSIILNRLMNDKASTINLHYIN